MSHLREDAGDQRGPLSDLCSHGHERVSYRLKATLYFRRLGNGRAELKNDALPRHPQEIHLVLEIGRRLQRLSGERPAKLGRAGSSLMQDRRKLVAALPEDRHASRRAFCVRSEALDRYGNSLELL